MIQPDCLIAWLHDIDKEDTYLVGAKNANLGEMINAKFPVPDGFALTTNAYALFIKENKLDLKIKHLLGTLHIENPDSLSQVSGLIKKVIKDAPMPEKLSSEILKSYKELGGVFHNPFVAIRSSATAEDSKDASFAGQQETYLNVAGEAALIERIKDVWASLFESRALYYRSQHHQDLVKARISLTVQRMIASEISGVMFTVDPVTNDKNKIVIEAIFGLGEYIVQGKVSPDHYELDKETLHILDKKKATQHVMLVKAAHENKEVKVSWLKNRQYKLSDSELKKVAEYGRNLEKHYFFPQDIEWAIEKGRVYITQTRPITTTENRSETTAHVVAKINAGSRPHLIGDPIHSGIKTGPIKVVLSPKDTHKVVVGDILVTPSTNNEYLPALKKAAAVVVEKAGRNSHIASISKELGVPIVVGVPSATKKLKNNDVITVNGKTGEIFKGNLLSFEKALTDVEIDHDLRTKTKLYINVSEPEVAVKLALNAVDGVGLLRSEHMIEEIGIHPRKLIKDGKSKVLVDKLATGIGAICKAFYPRPVYYRATDFKTNELRNLIGGADFEPHELNPLIGYRGAHRYMNDSHVFGLELEAMKRVRQKDGFNNLHLMLPFVRSVKELQEVKRIVHKVGLIRSKTFQVFMMAETPANVILVDQFIEAGIDGISIGSDDLTMLLLGTDRDNETVVSEYDIRSEAVLWAFQRIISACRKHGIVVSICGQAPSLYPEVVEKLVEWGVSSISVSPDALNHTRQTVHSEEKKYKKK